ncbi:MAG: DUF6702 family protein [Pseudomonadota bacterium]
MTVLARTGLALVASLMLTVTISAHQQKEAITRVLFNPNTGNIEVMHRFYLHDAEHAMRQFLEEAVDLLGSDADRASFEAYIHERFSLRSLDGDRIELSAVGSEIDDQFLWVYAEAPIPASLTGLTITHDGLRDIWPEQVNLVNVDRDRRVQSAVFAKSLRDASIRFESLMPAAR